MKKHDYNANIRYGGKYLKQELNAKNRALAIWKLVTELPLHIRIERPRENIPCERMRISPSKV